MHGKVLQPKEQVCTAYTRAPELCSESGVARAYTFASDAWSLGVISLQLAVGQVPWLQSESEKETASHTHAVRACHLPFKLIYKYTR